MHGIGVAADAAVPITPAYRSLVAWQRADDLFIRLHRLTLKAFAGHERFELGSQRGERLQFLRVAWSSLREAGYYVHVAERLGYISEEVRLDLEAEIRKVAAPLMGLIRRRESNGG